MTNEVTKYESEQQVKVVSDEFVQVATALVVKDAATYAQAGGLITTMGVPLLKAIEAYWAELVGDTYKAWRNACGKRKAQADAVQHGIDALKYQMLSYEEREKRRADQKAAASAAKGAPPTTVTPRVPAVEGIAHREVWKVVEVEAPEVVPREFCSPDLDKLNTYAKRMGPLAKVPGVRFEKVRSLAARGTP